MTKTTPQIQLDGLLFVDYGGQTRFSCTATIDEAGNHDFKFNNRHQQYDYCFEFTPGNHPTCRDYDEAKSDPALETEPFRALSALSPEAAAAQDGSRRTQKAEDLQGMSHYCSLHHVNLLEWLFSVRVRIRDQHALFIQAKPRSVSPPWSSGRFPT